MFFCQPLHHSSGKLVLKSTGFWGSNEKFWSCVGYIRSRGLNHRQFKSFLQVLNSDYPNVNYFCAVDG